jgi:hypothetical protein
MSPRLPDFFIVGAPKCGTTAMYHYLRQHPQVFMPDRKEPHFFSLDVVVPGAIRNPGDYHALFAGAGSDQLVGEASVSYLGSRAAAGGIHRACPDARIVAMLRDTQQVLESFHAQMVYECLAEDDDLGRAMSIQDEVRALILAHKGVPYVYEQLLAFDAQVERYRALFGLDRVHVIEHQAFEREPAAVFDECCAFLGLESGFRSDFPRINARKRARSMTIQRLLKRPPPRMESLRDALPARVRARLAEWVQRANTSDA